MWPTVNVHISHTHNHTHTPMRARALGGATMWYMRTFTQHQLTDWHNINKYEEYKNKKTWFECSGKHHTTHTPQTITKVNWKQRTRVSRWWIVESFRSHNERGHKTQPMRTQRANDSNTETSNQVSHRQTQFLWIYFKCIRLNCVLQFIHFKLQTKNPIFGLIKLFCHTIA